MSEISACTNNVRLKCDFYSASLAAPLSIHTTVYFLGVKKSARDGENTFQSERNDGTMSLGGLRSLECVFRSLEALWPRSKASNMLFPF